MRTAFGLTGVIAPSIFAALTVAVHLLNPRASWMQYTLSELALTHYGWIETLSLCVLAICVMSVAYGLYRNASRGRENRIAVGMFVAASVALFLIAGFKSSETASVTPPVLVHRASVGVLTVCFPAACLLLLPALRSNPRWRTVAIYSAIAGGFGILLDIAGAAMPRDLQQNVAGLWEKLFVADGIVWCQVFAVRLFVASRERVTAGHEPR